MKKGGEKMEELNKNYDVENMDLLIEELEAREELKCGCQSGCGIN